MADALLLLLASDLLADHVRIDSFGDALLAALVMSAASVVLETILGTNDDDAYTLRVTRRIARRQGAVAPTDVPGIVFLEIDGLARPVLRDAMRDGSAPNMARWIARSATGSPSGSPTSPRKPARARPASCSARTRAFPRFAGSRRRPAA